MTKRIFHSILGACLLVLLASGVMTFWTVYRSFVNEETRSLQKQAQLIASLLNSEAVPGSEIDELRQLDSTNLRIALISPDGTVLYDSDGGSIHDNHGSREEIVQASQNGKGFSIRYSNTISEETYNAAVRLENGSFIRVSSSHSSLLSLFVQALLPLGIMVPILIGLVWITARLLTRHIVDPINAIDLNHPLESCPYEQLQPLLERLESNNRQIRKQMHQIARRSRELETLSENMDEGLMIVGADGTPLSINKAADEIFGPQSPASTQERLQEMIHTALKRESVRHRLKKDGRVYSVEAAPILDENKVIGAIVLALDITEKQEARKRRQEFTANVTHELKTPLQTILSSAELLESGMVRPEDQTRFAGYILDEARRMIAMINDIIRLSRLENEGDQALAQVDVRALIDQTVEKFKSDADVHGITITVQTEPIVLTANARDIQDMVKNLLENAIRYNRENGRVKITLFKEGDQAVLKVEDTGQGIPAESIDRIFERFYTADPSRNSKGTGLGLAIVSHAVKNMKGTIQVESEPGKGSRFTIRLPMDSSNSN